MAVDLIFFWKSNERVGICRVQKCLGLSKNCLVRLESGQSQEVCVRIAAPGADGGGGGADASGADADWTLVHGEMPPDWPLPVPEVYGRGGWGLR